jgi:hypothetical protein
LESKECIPYKVDFGQLKANEMSVGRIVGVGSRSLTVDETLKIFFVYADNEMKKKMVSL